MSAVTSCNKRRAEKGSFSRIQAVICVAALLRPAAEAPFRMKKLCLTTVTRKLGISTNNKPNKRGKPGLVDNETFLQHLLEPSSAMEQDRPWKRLREAQMLKYSAGAGLRWRNLLPQRWVLGGHEGPHTPELSALKWQSDYAEKGTKISHSANLRVFFLETCEDKRTCCC